MKFSTLSFLFFIFFTKTSPSSAQATNENDAAVLHAYFDFALQKTKMAPGFMPPIAARAYAYLGLCTYESAIVGVPNYHSFSGKLEGAFAKPAVDESLIYDPISVSNAALHDLTGMFFYHLQKNEIEELDALQTTFEMNRKDSISIDILLRSKAYGQALANAIFAYSKTDGGNEGQNENYDEGYAIKKGQSLWLPQEGQVPLVPHWGDNRLFFQKNKAVSKNIAPIAFSSDSSSVFYKAAFETYQRSKNLTPTERKTVLYWADGAGTYSPAGHSLSILRSLLKSNSIDLTESAMTYALVSMSISDAFVVGLKAKYQHNLIRPVDYIRQYIDKEFQTVIPTPPFPEFPSGHSTQAAAFAANLEVLFDKNMAIVDSTYILAYNQRIFASPAAMAAEVAESRLLAGLHYRFSNAAGLELGRSVSQEGAAFFRTLNPDISLVLSQKSALPDAVYVPETQQCLFSNTANVGKITVQSIDGRMIENLSTFAPFSCSSTKNSHITFVFFDKKDVELNRKVVSLQGDNYEGRKTRPVINIQSREKK